MLLKCINMYSVCEQQYAYSIQIPVQHLGLGEGFL